MPRIKRTNTDRHLSEDETSIAVDLKKKKAKNSKQKKDLPLKTKVLHFLINDAASKTKKDWESVLIHKDPKFIEYLVNSRPEVPKFWIYQLKKGSTTSEWFGFYHTRKDVESDIEIEKGRNPTTEFEILSLPSRGRLVKDFYKWVLDCQDDHLLDYSVFNAGEWPHVEKSLDDYDDDTVEEYVIATNSLKS